MTELWRAVIYTVCYLLILIAVVVLRKFTNLRGFTIRKLAHVLICLGAIPAVFLFRSLLTVLILTVLLELSLLLYRKLRAFPDLLESGLDGVGDLLLPVTIFLLYALCRETEFVYVVSLGVLGVADPMAALVGVKSGKPYKTRLLTGKSLTGTMAFFAFAIIVHIVCVAVLPTPEPVGLFIVLLASVTATIMELSGTRGFDNVTIPAGIYLVFQFGTIGIMTIAGMVVLIIAATAAGYLIQE